MDDDSDSLLARARALLAAPDEPTRLRGVHALRDDVADHAAAAAELVLLLGAPGDYVPQAARAALQDLGADAVPALVAALAAADPVVRRSAAWALARDGVDPGDAARSALRRAAADTDAAVRQAAAGAFGRIAAPADVACEALVALAQDREWRVREQAVHSLAPHVAAHPHLLDALEDAQPAVRAAAAEALARQPLDAAALARVQRALDEEPSPHVAAPLRALLERREVVP